MEMYARSWTCGLEFLSGSILAFDQMEVGESARTGNGAKVSACLLHDALFRVRKVRTRGLTATMQVTFRKLLGSGIDSGLIVCQGSRRQVSLVEVHGE